MAIDSPSTLRRRLSASSSEVPSAFLGTWISCTFSEMISVVTESPEFEN